MDKMKALNMDELEAVNGGATSPAGNNESQDKKLEFQNAWNSLGLSPAYSNDFMETKYKEWVQNGYQPSAFDFLISLSK